MKLLAITIYPVCSINLITEYVVQDYYKRELLLCKLVPVQQGKESLKKERQTALDWEAASLIREFT